MLFDNVERPAIEKLVRQFYATVLQDDVVGPFFIRKLGNDLKNEKWYEHLHTLDEFWLLMMTGESNYKGHPFPVHAFLGPLEPETFERWLELFHRSVHELFVPELAAKFYDKADTLAKQFIENLGLDEDDEDW